MRALDLANFGAQPAFVEKDIAPPSGTQVQVAIKACGLNFADLLMIEGKYQDTPTPPFTMGMELSGVVIAAGPQASLPLGTRVAVFSGQGGLAQYGNFAQERCTPLPVNMSFAQAAGFQIAYGTSHLALTARANLRPEDTLVVLGAAGGVGLTAVEIGKSLGARVIAVARGAEKLQVAQQAGADLLIDSDSPDLKQQLKDAGGVDVIYDALGGDIGEAAFRALRPGGHHLLIGFASGQPPQLPLNHALVKNITLHGLYWGGYLKLAPLVLTQSMHALFQMFERGELHPPVTQEYAFDQVLTAFCDLKARRSTGKLVVKIE
ncbi:zinc-binding dehydrogenase [Thioclava sp. SK-1]|uniref:NADPH:quinone oxidoreductase family protein n=1 Tax=Thioclava sp. SK-1 TaxID=1889770 RepID=UPI00082715AE|nr:NADPH:quinone oxidoreductase family protein [Thioclava sp. SK-1]OCX62306.1 zinc-binding dehydrogenase [Thioclava sp. SK-1]